MGAVLGHGIYEGEDYDARLHPEGSCSPGFRETGWEDVRVVRLPALAVHPRTAPPARRVQELPVQTVMSTAAGRTVVDFGQVLTGWVRLRVEGLRGRPSSSGTAS